MTKRSPHITLITSVIVIFILIKTNFIAPSPHDYFMKSVGLEIYSIETKFNDTSIIVRCKIKNSDGEMKKWTVRMKVEAEINGKKPPISIDVPDAVNDIPIGKGIIYFLCNWTIYWSTYEGMIIKAKLYVITDKGLIKIDEMTKIL